MPEMRFFGTLDAYIFKVLPIETLNPNFSHISHFRLRPDDILWRDFYIHFK